MTNPRPRPADGTAGRQPISPSDVERERPGPVGSLASEGASALKNIDSEANPDSPLDSVSDPAGEDVDAPRSEEPVTGGVSKDEIRKAERSAVNQPR